MENLYDVAKYFLKLDGRLGKMRLNRLLFYAQAWYLAKHKKPLSQEDFRVWKTGPVCKELEVMFGKEDFCYGIRAQGNHENRRQGMPAFRHRSRLYPREGLCRTAFRERRISDFRQWNKDLARENKQAGKRRITSILGKVMGHKILP